MRRLLAKLIPLKLVEYKIKYGWGDMDLVRLSNHLNKCGLVLKIQVKDKKD